MLTQSLYKDPIIVPVDEARKIIIDQIVQSIQEQKERVQLLFICTHNSRRSQACELWAQTWKDFYKLTNLDLHSAGIKRSTFNYRMADAARRSGFRVELHRTDQEETYLITSPFDKASTKGYHSIQLDDKMVPNTNVISVVTCPHVWKKFTPVKGEVSHFYLPYEDPNWYDGQVNESELYAELFSKIGSEMKYLMKRLKSI